MLAAVTMRLREAWRLRETPVEVGERERGESVLLKFKFGMLK